MSVVIKKAGDVVGTPDWQLNLMYETESDRLWEEQNKQPEDPLDSIDMDNLLEASCNLNTAKTCDNDNALDWIAKAIELIKGTPEAEKLADIYDRLSDLTYEMVLIHDRLHLKWRERW